MGTGPNQPKQRPLPPEGEQRERIENELARDAVMSAYENIGIDVGTFTYSQANGIEAISPKTWRLNALSSNGTSSLLRSLVTRNSRPSKFEQVPAREYREELDNCIVHVGVDVATGFKTHPKGWLVADNSSSRVQIAIESKKQCKIPEDGPGINNVVITVVTDNEGTHIAEVKTEFQDGEKSGTLIFDPTAENRADRYKFIPRAGQVRSLLGQSNTRTFQFGALITRLYGRATDNGLTSPGEYANMIAESVIAGDTNLENVNYDDLDLRWRLHVAQQAKLVPEPVSTEVATDLIRGSVLRQARINEKIEADKLIAVQMAHIAAGKGMRGLTVQELNAIPGLRKEAHDAVAHARLFVEMTKIATVQGVSGLGFDALSKIEGLREMAAANLQRIAESKDERDMLRGLSLDPRLNTQQTYELIAKEMEAFHILSYAYQMKKWEATSIGDDKRPRSSAIRSRFTVNDTSIMVGAGVINRHTIERVALISCTLPKNSQEPINSITIMREGEGVVNRVGMNAVIFGHRDQLGILQAECRVIVTPNSRSILYYMRKDGGFQLKECEISELDPEVAKRMSGYAEALLDIPNQTELEERVVALGGKKSAAFLKLEADDRIQIAINAETLKLIQNELAKIYAGSYDPSSPLSAYPPDIITRIKEGIDTAEVEARVRTTIPAEEIVETVPLTPGEMDARYRAMSEMTFARIPMIASQMMKIMIENKQPA